MNTQYMKVNPSELVIDLPVDEDTVKQKMYSLQANGMVQPVIVWLQGMRIIDGFHRTVAAQRLGWSEIDCIVQDCTEEAFWDARIQSAKQHVSVEKKRLESWILSCWNTTDWDEELIKSEIDLIRDDDNGIADFIRFSMDVIDHSGVEMWSYSSTGTWRCFLEFCKEHHVDTWSEVAKIPDSDLLEIKFPHPRSLLKKVRAKQDEKLCAISRMCSKDTLSDFLRFATKKETLLIAIWNAMSGYSPDYIQSWFQDKSEKWGISINGISRAIFCSMGPGYEAYANNSHLARHVSLSQFSSLSDNRLVGSFERAEKKIPSETNGEYIQRIKTIKENAERERNQFLTQEKEKQQKEQEDRRLEQLRISQWEQSPAGQEEIRKKRVAYLDGQIEHVFNRIDALDTYGFPEALRRLTALIAAIENKIEESFPDYKKKTRANPLVVENIELRKRIEDHQRKIESLERALKAKASVTPKLSGVIALSESELV